MEESDLVESDLSTEIVADGHRLKVEIYSSGRNDWILEVVDESNMSIVWGEEFETDHAALSEFKRCLEQEGVTAIIGEASNSGAA